ncbi:RNA polymerase sigma factor [Paraburkholderia lacunae]|uniref:RNA polymerase sigma factor n=1 Tax=Paraburkholderia lacunae TaxID=2211104 RepID=A0A370MX24_9BURK|nr:RNA polymerase sigma factor [Paraburkholderia lacunae]RDJ97717.1 RNA polymerase sigma factor [Paraburkholderia lacunae]
MNTAEAQSTSPADDEREAVRRIVAGDRCAFELLMRRHNRRLYRLARATLRNDAEAEDALQAAYLSAYRSIARFRGDATLLTWLSRLVLNECYGRLRREARRQNVIPMVDANAHVDIDAMIAQDSDSPDKALARAELRALLERKLDELPEVFRVVFVLRAVEEMSVEETAQCLDIPQATVRSRHFRAKSLLRESLAHEIDLAERDLFEFGGARCNRVVANVLQRVADEDDHSSGGH